MQFTSPKIEDIKLNADNPMAEIKMSWQPLSVRMQDFKIDSKGVDEKPVEYKLAVKGKLLGLIIIYPAILWTAQTPRQFIRIKRSLCFLQVLPAVLL